MVIFSISLSFSFGTCGRLIISLSSRIKNLIWTDWIIILCIKSMPIMCHIAENPESGTLEMPLSLHTVQGSLMVVVLISLGVLVFSYWSVRHILSTSCGAVVTTPTQEHSFWHFGLLCTSKKNLGSQCCIYMETHKSLSTRQRAYLLLLL